MAKLNHQSDSDDELPELFSLLGRRPMAIGGTLPKTSKQEVDEIPYPEMKTQNLANKDLLTLKHPNTQRAVTEVFLNKAESRKQWPLGYLKQAHINSLLPPASDASINNSRIEDDQNTEAVDCVIVQSSPDKSANGIADYNGFVQVSANTSELDHSENYSSISLSGFIVPDSASDGEALTSRSPKKKHKKEKKKKKKKKQKSRFRQTISTASPQEPSFQASRQPQSKLLYAPGATDLLLHKEKNKSRICLETPPSNEPFGSEPSYAHPNLDDRPKSFHPTSRSPYHSEASRYSLTPPPTPSTSKSKSPSKRHRIPPSRHRPSIDAFWSQDVINDWNEQYSPKKIIESSRKIQFHSVNEHEEPSPSEASRKSPLKSPAKKDKKIVQLQKQFDNQKYELATTFLAEVDRRMTNGQVAAMADSTGGIRIIWSKKLSSTAGRANWRRETVYSKSADGSVSNSNQRHHASIELAEKIIDDEGQIYPNLAVYRNKLTRPQDRLTNVIAHEYCHLANFMISGIKDRPHGKDFKEWARKCTDAFSYRNINVTTKHSYAIAYKYIWTCVSPTCGLEYKRHSRSIDPSKHSCGNCKGKLMQVQPPPRKGVGEGKRSDYQNFVKRENERVRLENPEARFGEIMSILGRDFRERKSKEAGSVNSNREYGALGETGSKKLDCLDSVVRKLDFLDLGY